MIERIISTKARLIPDLRAKGRTDRQIEKILALPSGILGRRWLVDDSAERAVEEAQRKRAEFYSRWRFPHYPDRVFQGWRPDGDCVRTRPNAPPLRSVPPRKPGAA